MPTMPPGQDRPAYPIDPPEPALPPGAHSPPPRPPPAAPAPPEVVVKHGACRPIDAPTISDAQLSSFRAACDNGAYQLLESFGVEECVFSADDGAPGESCLQAKTRTCAGMRDRSTCVVKQNREITPGKCKKETSKLVHLAGKKLGALLGTPVQCPASSALLSWKLAADARPWYTRREEPGRYAMESTCCPAMELDVCRTKRSGCDFKTTSPMTALLRVPGPQCATALDEVLTGWKLTGEGCPGGRMRFESTCCMSPTFYDSEGANNVEGTEADDKAEAATEALESGNTKAIAAAPVQDFKAADEERTGPLVDTLTIQEGASYVPRALAKPEHAADAFDAVLLRPNDPNAKSFCKRHVDDFDEYDLATALGNCDAEASNARGKDYGNKFMRVSASFGTGFSGEWGFRAESRAFHGALVLEQKGVGRLISKELTSFNSREGINAATITVNLGPGTYTVSLYAAYDARSHDRAKSAEQGKDALLFLQETTCKVRTWRTLSMTAMETCGGNEVRPNDQPQDGAVDQLMTVREIEPRVDFEEDEDPNACGAVSEDSFDPTKLDGKSLEPCPRKAEAADSSELSAKNMADFDGAFLSFKVTTAGAKDKLKEGAKGAAKGAAKDEAAERTGVPLLGAKREFEWNGEIAGDTYFVMPAKMVFLCFMMEIDIRIIPGPEEDGGGIHAKFTFLWAMGNVELTYINAQVDVVPFDFSAMALKAMVTDPVGFLLSIYIYLGIEIRATIINIIMEFIEPALRLVMMFVFIPRALAVFVAQKILELAVKIIEGAKKAVNKAQDALSAAEKAAGRALNRIAGQYLHYQRMEETANIAGRMTGSTCRSSFGRNQNNGCITYNGKEKCTWQPSRQYKIPQDCDKLIARWRDQAGAWRDQCCGYWTLIKRVFLKILYTIAKIVVFMILLVPKILLKILEAILVLAEIALKLAEIAVKIAVCFILAPFNNQKQGLTLALIHP